MKVVQIPMTKADLFLRIFETYPGTLKRSEILYASFSAKNSLDITRVLVDVNHLICMYE